MIVFQTQVNALKTLKGNKCAYYLINIFSLNGHFYRYVVLKYNDNLTTVQFVHGNAEPPKEMFNYDAQLSPIGRGSVPKGNCQFVHGSAEPPKEMFNYDAQLPPPGGRESMAKGNCQFVHGNAEPPKEKFNYGVQLLPSGRGSVPKGNYHNKQPFHPSEPPVLNNKPDVIRLRPTHRVIHG
ncbi:hypothetical protein L195_g055002, partial [Trifolium pratense]